MIAAWRERKRHDRARRALIRQLLYQRRRSQKTAGHEPDAIEGMRRDSQRVRGLLASVAAIPDPARVLEVGYGSRGLVFYFLSNGQRVALDPLAVDYLTLYPLWQRQAPTCAALGEALPFGDGVFDVVLCTNVVDHAEDPRGIVMELVRVLRPDGLLFFSVNIHHGFYRFVSRLHGAWNAVGIHFEIGPFADHTVHMTLDDARRVMGGLPLRIAMQDDGIAAARMAARTKPARHLGDRLKRLFFKNARCEMIAVKDAVPS